MGFNLKKIFTYDGDEENLVGTEDEYYNMSKQAFLISEKYTKDLYVDNIVKNYVIWRSDDENSNY